MASTTPVMNGNINGTANDDIRDANDGLLPNETYLLSEAERNLLLSQIPFYKFVLTGGPCGGKTTALARLYTFLRERGFEVITCPETFTILASNGMSLDFFSTEGMDVVIQQTVMDVQLSIEDGLERVLKARGKPAVLLCDRGLMDSAAYMAPDKWQKVLTTRHVQINDLRDNRYNAVFHLVTAAQGAEQFYTLENNAARTETPEMARIVDKKTQEAWVGHPHLYVFDNSSDFEGKLQRLVDTISKLVGLPTNLSRRSAKFLLRGIPDLSKFPPDIDCHVFEVEKVYLVHHQENLSISQSAISSGSKIPNKGGSYSFVRRRTNIDQNGQKQGSVYQLTTVQRTADGEMIEQKRIITAREYGSALKSRDLKRHVVRQQRISFLYQLQSFTIHVSWSKLEQEYSHVVSKA
jgi:predicted ATPase